MSNLLERVRRAGSDARPSWTPERAAANELAMRQRAHSQGRVRVLGGVAVVAALVIAVLTLRPALRPTGGVIHFADGSTAVPLDGDSRLIVTSVTPALLSSTLVRGGFRFRVTHDPSRVFRVVAGAVQVEVLGTEFSVQHAPHDRARVEVYSGRVRVSANGQRTELVAGESGEFPAPPEPKAPAATTPPSQPALPTAGAPPPRQAAAKRAWIHLAQSGDYDGAYAALKRTREVARGPVELMLAADAARLSHHAQDALAPLRALVAQYPGDPRAPLAAFTLGRVLLEDLGRPHDAAAAFARARDLAPRGPLAEDALAREVEAWSRAGELAPARERADEYLRRYPSGLRVRSVRRFGGVE